jgi:SAM-dependent methyltransferase
MKSDKSFGYWDDFYRAKTTPISPSQFAVFSLSECLPDFVVDIGCGNGRDTLFFAQSYVESLGIDGSLSAIEACVLDAQRFNFSNTKFINIDISDKSLLDVVSKSIPTDCKNLMIYCRFFVHAIDIMEEEALLRLVSELLLKYPGRFACEFRTNEDEMLPKMTPNHFRRFVDPAAFVSVAKMFGLHCEYFVQGRGMAKFGRDDAHVARVILTLAPEIIVN